MFRRLNTNNKFLSKIIKRYQARNFFSKKSGENAIEKIDNSIIESNNSIVKSNNSLLKSNDVIENIEKKDYVSTEKFSFSFKDNKFIARGEIFDGKNGEEKLIIMEKEYTGFFPMLISLADFFSVFFYHTEERKDIIVSKRQKHKEISN